MKVRIETYYDGSGVSDYLTLDKWYKAVGAINEDTFRIRDDRGKILVCRYYGCSHLGGGNWEVSDE